MKTLLVLVMFFCFFWASSVNAQSTNQQARPRSNQDADVNKLANLLSAALKVKSQISIIQQKYRIRIIRSTQDEVARTFPDGKFPYSDGKLHYDYPEKTDELTIYLGMLINEIEKYPADFFEKVGLKNIVLCENMLYDGNGRNGVPDHAQKTLFLDIYNNQPNKKSIRNAIELNVCLANTFHHELYHMVEAAMRKGNMYYKWDEWEALNKSFFKYSGGGNSVLHDKRFHDAGIPDINDSGFTNKGFINRYSMTGEEEDRAEVFAFMMKTFEPEVMQKLFASDEIVCKKVWKMIWQMNVFYWGYPVTPPRKEKPYWETQNEVCYRNPPQYLQFKDHDYWGETIEGVPTGYGVERFFQSQKAGSGHVNNDVKFAGWFKNGARNGFGILTRRMDGSSKLQRIAGTWTNGLANVKGK